ncbi:hypothetical protein [Rubrobacter aplysinae]|uniref:hypothetical protein n=1 Tax=Rubrobacter aplysinae TaxID=909625 RepID=UPI00128C0D28|nr:hypothetical protein [Rubrobacter aplysinae]
MMKSKSRAPASDTTPISPSIRIRSLSTKLTQIGISKKVTPKNKTAVGASNKEASSKASHPSVLATDKKDLISPTSKAVPTRLQISKDMAREIIRSDNMELEASSKNAGIKIMNRPMQARMNATPKPDKPLSRSFWTN